MIGSGGREHAIAKAVSESKSEHELYAFMSSKNPGIAKLCKEFVVGNINDPALVAKFASNKKIGLAVVGPEAPLEAGIIDALEKNEVGCAGPVKSAARLETDKAFARDLMSDHRIEGSPIFGNFTEVKDALDFIDSFGKPVAIKPAGLTGGKGVKVVGHQLKDLDAARNYAREVLEMNIGKLKKVVIEERLEGEEFTLQAFVDGKRVVGSPMVQDHKKAFLHDEGPNTGGMGSYSDAGYVLPFLTKEDYEKGLGIMQKTIDAFRKETGIEYKGFLYGGFIVTKDGVRVLEFNARLGDPEAMNILPILRTDFINILERIVDGSLKDAKFERKATVCKYLVPKGYPDSPKKDEMLDIDEKLIERTGAKLYYAAVNEKEGKIYTGTSRSIGILGIGKSIYDAEKIAESSIGFVKGELYYRKDIGTKELIEKRIKHMKEIRG